jgi:hypothetical protein
LIKVLFGYKIEKVMTINYTLSHYFFPGISNNQKAKILHNISMFVFVFILITYQIALQFVPVSGVNILGYAANISVNDVVNLTNQKRTENGLESLEYNEVLASAAHTKGNDMLEKDYWSHVAPDGTEPWKFFIDAGYSYRFAGENLAKDFSNASSAVDAWMASPSHRDNMLSSKYHEIGIAVVEGDVAGVDTTIIVQLFGTRYSDALPSVPIASAEITNVAQVVPEPTSIPAPTVIPTPTSAPFVASADNVVKPPVGLAQGVQQRGQRMLISPFSTTKGLSLATIFLLFSVLVVDAIITHKRKVSRIGGRSFAHLAFLGMILAIAMIAKAGSIL